MATSRTTAPASWGVTPTFTASEDTALLIRNTTKKTIFFAVTDSDAPTAFDEGFGHRILPSWSSESEVGLTLKADERFWAAMPNGEDEFTLTTGPA